MGKPSIFSKEYEKKMKRRRIRNFVLVVVCILVVCSIAFKEVLGNSFNSINVSIRNVFTKAEVNKDAHKTNEEVKQESKETKKEETKETVKEEKKEESVEVEIGNGAKVLVIYELKNGERNFSSINPGNSVVSYSISPSGKKVILFDEKNQNIYLINENRESKDISMKKYTTSTGDFTIDKVTQLTTNPNYIWHSLPKFLDETHIVYVSQLPWLNKDDKYLWTVDLNNLNYVVNYNIQGKVTSLGNSVDKGLEIKLDNGDIKYMQPNGSIQ